MFISKYRFKNFIKQMKNSLDIYVHHVVNVNREYFYQDLGEFFMPFIFKTMWLKDADILFILNVGGFSLQSYLLLNPLSIAEFNLYKTEYISYIIEKKSISPKNPFFVFLQKISEEDKDLFKCIFSYIKELREVYPTKNIQCVIFPLIENRGLMERFFYKNLLK